MQRALIVIRFSNLFGNSFSQSKCVKYGTLVSLPVMTSDWFFVFWMLCFDWLLFCWCTLILFLWKVLEKSLLAFILYSVFTFYFLLIALHCLLLLLSFTGLYFLYRYRSRVGFYSFTTRLPSSFPCFGSVWDRLCDGVKNVIFDSVFVDRLPYILPYIVICVVVSDVSPEAGESRVVPLGLYILILI